MSVALPSWATRDGILPLPPLDLGLTQRLLEAAARRELSDDELAAVRAVCARVDDPSDFLRAMIDRWQFKGAGERFMARLFGWLARESDVLWLGDMLRRQKPWTDHTWARILPRARAVLLLDAVGTPLAMLEIARFRDSTRVVDLHEACRELLYDHTRARGLQPGEEGDLAAPTLGFVDGLRTFDAPRGLQIDAREPDRVHVVREVDGRTFAHVPAAARSDDASLVERSRQHWALLRPAIVEVLERGADRLERAMVTQRRWDHECWRRDWYAHGLLGALARRVVWRGQTDAGELLFFVTDEREAVRVDGTTVNLDALWGFEVAHPTSFGEEDWQTVFVDHEIIQPFEQIQRVARPSTGNLEPGRLIASKRWGWELRSRYVGEERDMLVLMTREHDVRLHLHPGLGVTGAGRLLPNQAMQTSTKTEVWRRTPRRKLPVEKWPAHVVLEIELLRARAGL